MVSQIKTEKGINDKSSQDRNDGYRGTVNDEDGASVRYLMAIDTEVECLWKLCHRRSYGTSYIGVA